MSGSTAEFSLERLYENGARRIYGYPGDGINAIVSALEKFNDRIEFTQVRHEEQAAFMAMRAREVDRRGGRVPGDVASTRPSPSPQLAEDHLVTLGVRS